MWSRTQLVAVSQHVFGYVTIKPLPRVEMFKPNITFIKLCLTFSGLMWLTYAGCFLRVFYGFQLMKVVPTPARLHCYAAATLLVYVFLTMHHWLLTNRLMTTSRDLWQVGINR